MTVVRFTFVFLGIALTALISSCSSDPQPFNCELTDLAIALNSKTNATDCTTPDGTIVVEASAGKEPYTFFLNDQSTGQPTGEFTALSAGIYSVSVKDGNGCIKSKSNIVIDAQNFSFSTTILEDNACLGGNGEATVEVLDGNPPYTFNIAGGAFSTTNAFVGLSSGNQIIGVKDVTGCIVTLTLTVPKGNSGTSWQNEILPIMKTSCAVTGCHNGISRPDFRIYANAKKFAAEIKTKTKNKTMPLEGPALTSNQIDLIGCWVDDGAVEN